MLYGVKGGGFVMLTGEVGTGKTTIIRCLLEQLPANTEIAIVLNPMANVHEMLSTICDEYGVFYEKSSSGLKSLTDALYKYLLANHTSGKNTVLLIDEAQLLSADVLEHIRLLTNLETDTQKLMQIILVGQPELNELLGQPRLRQLSQRITARFHLSPLTLEETHHYIGHRLAVAGMPKNKNPFSPKIIKLIHHLSGGIPRMINIVCERTLIGAYGHNKLNIDKDIFRLAKKEVEGNRQSNLATLDNRPLIFYATVTFSATVALATVFLMMQIFTASSQAPILADFSPAQEPIFSQTARTHELNLSNDAKTNTPSTLPSQASDSTTTRTTPTNTESGFGIDSITSARALLFTYMDLKIDTENPPCWQLTSQGYQCDSTKFDTWGEIELLNRPVVLALISAEKFKTHVVLIGLQNGSALIVKQDGTHAVMALSELGPLWTGDIFYAWKPPRQYSEPLTLGSSSATVKEVAEHFALIDTQPKPLTTLRFNSALKDRIKIFQRDNNLIADGILGERTLMKLNETLGFSTTLTNDFL